MIYSSYSITKLNDIEMKIFIEKIKIFLYSLK